MFVLYFLTDQEESMKPQNVVFLPIVYKQMDD